MKRKKEKLKLGSKSLDERPFSNKRKGMREKEREIEEWILGKTEP